VTFSFIRSRCVLLAVAIAMVACTAAAVASCGTSPAVGTWVNTGFFSYPSPDDGGTGTAKVVSKLFMKADGTWRLLDPIMNGDGTTTPHWWNGSYSTDGDSLDLKADGSAFATTVLAGGKLTLHMAGSDESDAALVFDRQ
jgi:hypothetical protein